MIWLLATRTAKLLPHLWQRPQDIIYVPAFILFGYYFAIMKIYALLTLHEVRSFFSEAGSCSDEYFRLVGALVLVLVTRQPRRLPCHNKTPRRKCQSSVLPRPHLNTRRHKTMENTEDVKGNLRVHPTETSLLSPMGNILVRQAPTMA